MRRMGTRVVSVFFHLGSAAPTNLFLTYRQTDFRLVMRDRGKNHWGARMIELSNKNDAFRASRTSITKRASDGGHQTSNLRTVSRVRTPRNDKWFIQPSAEMVLKLFKNPKTWGCQHSQWTGPKNERGTCVVLARSVNG